MRPTYGKMGFAGFGSLAVKSIIGPQPAGLPLFRLKRQRQISFCTFAFAILLFVLISSWGSRFPDSKDKSSRTRGRIRQTREGACTPRSLHRLVPSLFWFLGSWFPNSKTNQVREREGAFARHARARVFSPFPHGLLSHSVARSWVPGFLIQKKIQVREQPAGADAQG